MNMIEMLNLSKAIDMESKDYGIFFNFSIDDFNPPKPKIIGQLKPRYCRFCRCYEPQVTFEKEAHVIPQGFGNRYLTSREQCDRCNQKCGFFEGSLMTMISPVRGLAVSRTGSKGNIKFKTSAGSFIQSGVEVDKRIVTKQVGDPDLEFVSEENGFVTLWVTVRNVNFFSSIKALAMMAWHVIPENKLEKLEHFRSWFMGESKIELLVSAFLQQVTKVDNLFTGLTLYRRRNDNKALAPFVVTFTYEALALSLPIPDHSFHVEEPQIPLVNKIGNAEMRLQVISTYKDAAETLRMMIVLGPNKKGDENGMP